MRGKHNLKMFKRKEKFKFIQKVENLTCLSTAVLMVLSIFNYQVLAYATPIKNNNQILKTQVEYSKDYSKANIKFDLNSVDKEKYEITTIILDKDEIVIYDKNKVTEENKDTSVTYETIENGSYSFTIKYIEKQEKQVKAINENVKETEQEIEGDVENNKVKKEEEKVVVDVSKIKIVENEEAANHVVDTNKNDLTNSISEYENTVSDNNVEVITKEIPSENSSINLQNEFNIQSTVSEYGGKKKDVSNLIANKINGNIAILADEETFNEWTYQSTILTWKKTIDFSHSFKLKGKVQVGKITNSSTKEMVNSDGLAIAFHNDGINYKYKGNYSSNFGIYNGDGEKTGIQTKAIIAEIDAYDNSANQKGKALGDPYGKYSKGGHLAIMGLNGISKNAQILSMNYENKMNGLWMAGVKDFELTWELKNSNMGTLTLMFGGYSTSFSFSPKNCFEDFTKVNMTIGGGSGDRSLGITSEYLVFDDFRYTDNEPIGRVEYARVYDDGINSEGYFDIDSEYSMAELKDRDLNKYLGTGQTLDIKLAFYNNKQSAKEFTDDLSIEALKVGNLNLDIVPGSIAFQENFGKIIAKPNLVFDKNHPIQIKYLANKGIFNVYMKVKLPEELRLNINDYAPKALPYLQAEFLLGKKGMTQQAISRNITIATAPITEGNNFVFDVGTSPAQSSFAGENFDKENLARVQLYDEIVPENQKKRSLNTVINEGTVKLKHSQHYYFDDNKNSFVPITPEEFAYSSKTTKGETGLYAYEFDVSDNRRSKLVTPELISNKSVGKYTLNAIGMGTGKNSFILTNANEIVLSETEISNIVDTEDLKKYLIEKLSIKGYEDNGNLNIKKANIDINFNNLDIKDPKPGDYTITINAYNTDKSSYSNKNITIKVTENTWSYDTQDRTEENGVSGYIVIPKHINMDSGSGVDKDKLVAESEIFFANYASATNVNYNVLVEKQFNLIKTNDPSSMVTVTSSSNNGRDEANNKLYIGKIGNQNIKSKGLNVKFTAARDVVDRSRGKWCGYVTFYFSRAS